MRPPLWGADALDVPQLWFAHILEYMTQTTGADIRFKNVVALNPMYRGRTYRTHWYEKGALKFEDFSKCIPKGWRMPVRPDELLTLEGRNFWLHRHGTRWRWRYADPHLDTLDDWLIPNNNRLSEPLDYTELRGIARSIDRFHAAGGKPYNQRGLAEKRSGGIKSGQVRRQQVAERDNHILRLSFADWSVREITNELRTQGYKIGKSTVHDVLNRHEVLQLTLDDAAELSIPPKKRKQMELDRIVHPLHRQGKSQRQIQHETGIPRTTVQRSISRFPGSG